MADINNLKELRVGQPIYARGCSFGRDYYPAAFRVEVTGYDYAVIRYSGSNSRPQLIDEDDIRQFLDSPEECHDQ